MQKVRLAEEKIDLAVARLLGHEYALKFLALPIDKTYNHVRVATSEPGNAKLIAHIADIMGHFIVPVAAEEDDLRFYIDKIFGGEAMDSIASRFLVEEKLKNRADDMKLSDELIAEISAAPAVRFIDSLIEAGVLNRASDIHIEPFGRYLRARYRVDGRLSTYSKVDISLLSNVISRLKIMGGLDIAEKRLPQDGNFSIKKIDFRLSTLPTINGEKAVIRLLYGQSFIREKNDLGFCEKDLARLTELFARPYGAIFMTGPTGSGKSTTLNCFLHDLNDEEKNIVTVEDPVENPILGVSHVNVDRRALNFAGALRHILRQDPDVIMIGEIRDEETARIAIQAAITGHVVLSTLHTNDAAGVTERLCDMGIEPYLTAAALNGVISQRLVRRICRECSTETVLSSRHAALLNLPPETRVRKGAGCPHCNNTGYHSRFAVYEYIILNEEMRIRLRTHPEDFAAEIRKRAGLRESAIRALLAGNTTADEVIRALNCDASGDGE
jgi:type IV pilus assembly protein PilB